MRNLLPRRSRARQRGLLAGTIIVAVVLVALLATTVLSAMVAKRTIQAAAEDSYAYVGDLMSERVASFAGAASDVVLGTGAEIARRDGDLTGDALLRALTDRLDREPSVGTVFVADAGGFLTAVARTDDGYSKLEVTPIAGGAEVLQVDYDSDLVETGRDQAVGTYDLESRPWYVVALESDGLAWSEPYVSARNGEVVVSPVTAVREDGEVIAVVGADLDVELLADLLEDIPIGDDARAFILTGDGQVVAAPAGDRDEFRRLVESESGIPEAGDLGLPTLGPQPPEGSRPPTASEPPPDAIRSEGDVVSLERQMDESTGLDWVLHLDAQADDLMPSVSTMSRATVMVTAISFLLVVIAGIVALRLWLPIRMLRQRAATDALTGLANRYEYHRRARAILRSAEQSGQNVLVVALDLDNFKPVNDEYGHDAGDVILAAVGDALLESVRSRDLAARVGGDEFVVVMRLGERGSPVEVARRLRDDVAEAILESCGGAAGVGVTAGFSATSELGYELRHLQSAADEALVTGKRARKGRSYAYGHRTTVREDGQATAQAGAPAEEGPEAADDAAPQTSDDAPTAGSLPGN
ncbi:sensor domain-containing diguanylate cyclase [Demequina mangrovi]|uniref:Diguanylate cyclase (GGDEF) domain-containing protein n=1 Tax=Demequina mangrovi TaxID=1043493 RepID=A0A1H6YY47_9MICO|nr:diguanylate cyclase [Demequina mangrovi]SEJ46131.1 diguanylate cyclase (GGDEF) domain-containing protein [Demequina mangrovi]